MGGIGKALRHSRQHLIVECDIDAAGTLVVHKVKP